MSTPVLKKEYLDMVPEFSGEPTELNRFINICDKLVTKFYVAANPEDFQNDYLFSTILNKIKGAALEVVVSSNSYNWIDVRSILLTGYLDKRDSLTLNLEMAQMKQEPNETPFVFYQRIQKLLSLQTAYFVNKEPSKSPILCEYVNKLALRVLLRGLHEPLGSLMRTKNPSTLAEALNMLTNDFQFKTRSSTNTNQSFSKTQAVHRHPNNFNVRPHFNNFPGQTPRTPFPNSSSFQQPNQYPVRYPNNFVPPLRQNQFQRPIQPNNSSPKPQPMQNRPYLPTPMSVSTTRTEVPKGNAKLYQMTGHNLDNNLSESQSTSDDNSQDNVNLENYQSFSDLQHTAENYEESIIIPEVTDADYFLE